MLLVVAQANAQQPEFRPDLDWKYKWHGQTTAVDVISKGKALQGYHFNNNYNRIKEAPWNAIQTLLGAYFVARLEESKTRASSCQEIERLVVTQCRAVMAMLSSQQSLYEGNVIYQIDDWRPENPTWHRIWEQPRIANAILNTDRMREEKIRQFLGMKVIPLRTVDNCEMESTLSQYSLSQDYSDGFEISWSHSSDPLKIHLLIEKLKASGILLENEIREIDSIIKIFDDCSNQDEASRHELTKYSF